jgi:serine/threonine protein phosphatase PrpC
MWRPWRRSFLIDRPLLCVVADGMGGHGHGEVASATAVNYLAAAANRMATPTDVTLALIDADREIYREIERDPTFAGMGTTIVGLLLHPERQLWFNVGDSRLYHHRDGFLRQVSVDDVRSGGEGPGRESHRSHSLLQSLGGRKGPTRLNPHVGVDQPPLVPSRWLLCSDGLTDMLGLPQMEAALRKDDLGAWVDLFGSAMEAGAADNLSIMLVSIQQDTGRDIHGP